MKKTVLIALLLCGLNNLSAQTVVFSQDFSSPDATLFSSGWIQTNQSEPIGPSVWYSPSVALPAFATGGNTGGNTSFITADLNSTTGAGTISNWLITPSINVKNGDIVKFYAKKGGTGTGDIFADNLQLRMSTNGDGSAIPSSGATDLGDFTTLALEINPTLNATSFPFTWTLYSYTVSGIQGTSLIPCKFALRYYVTDGGSAGTASDIIGIDDFKVESTTFSNNDFFKQNFVVYPNPVKDIISVKNNNNSTITSAEIIDMNGRVVKNLAVEGLENGQNNISDLTEGLYLLQITTTEGVGMTKIIKK